MRSVFFHGCLQGAYRTFENGFEERYLEAPLVGIMM